MLGSTSGAGANEEGNADDYQSGRGLASLSYCTEGMTTVSVRFIIMTAVSFSTLLLLFVTKETSVKITRIRSPSLRLASHSIERTFHSIVLLRRRGPGYRGTSLRPALAVLS